MPKYDAAAGRASSKDEERTIRPVTRHDLDGMFLAGAAVCGCAAIIVLAVSMASESAREQSRGTPMVVSLGLALSAALCDGLCIGNIREHDRSLAVIALICSSVLAACSGAVMPFIVQCTQPVTVGACFASCCVAVDMAIMLVLVSNPTVNGVIDTILIASVCVMLPCAATLLFTLQASLLAGIVLALAVCCLQMLPNIVVHVPDRYLVEWRTYMTRRWTVRGGIPEQARVLTRADVHDDMQTFQSRYSTGFVICLTLTLASYAAVACSCAYNHPYDRIGFLALSSALFLFLGLKPRQSGRPFERYAMRFGAIVVVLICCTRISQALPMVRSDTLALASALAVGAAGLIMAFCMLAQHSGFHSLVLSRIGDALCFASMMITPPSAFFAVGALEFIRGL